MKMVDGKGPWGKHLLLDVYGVDKLSQLSVRLFFAALIATLKMESLGPFVIEEMDEENNKGISAVQMITTSSITLHEDAIRRRLYLDIFSCADFDEKEVEELIRTWEPTQINSRIILRD